MFTEDGVSTTGAGLGGTSGQPPSVCAANYPATQPAPGEAFQNINQTRPPSQSHDINMMRDTDKQVTDVNMLS